MSSWSAWTTEVAERVRQKAQPFGIPVPQMKADEQARWIAGAEAAFDYLACNGLVNLDDPSFSAAAR